MRLTNKNLSDENFMQALGRLVSQPVKSPKTAYSIAKLARIIEQKVKLRAEVWQKLVSTYAERDAEGNFVHPENNKNSVALKKETLEEFQKAVVELDSIDFEVAIYPLNEDTLEGATLSGADILALSPLLEIK